MHDTTGALKPAKCFEIEDHCSDIVYDNISFGFAASEVQNFKLP